MRVTEGRHVDAEQLQLRGQVGTREAGLVRGDRRGGRLGHLVAGEDQAGTAVRGEVICHCATCAVSRCGTVVDRDAAALADRQPGGAGELVAWADAGREHHEIRGEFGAVGELHPGHGAVVAGDDLLGARARVHGQAHVLDGAQQRRAAALVDLHGHQARRELHDVRGQSEPLQGARGFEPEQAAADHRAGRRPRLRVLLDGEQVLDGAVHEAALGVLAGHRRDEGVRAGGEDQGVVRDDQTRARRDLPGLPVDRLGRVAEVQFDAVRGDELGVGEGEFLRQRGPRSTR